MHHIIPRLHTQDVVLSLWGFDLSIRQFLLLLIAGLVAVNCYVLTPDLPEYVRWAMGGFPFASAVLFGWIRVAGQHLETWLFAFLRFYVHPRLFVWRPLIDRDGGA